MAIKTLFGNRITPIEAITDVETGEFNGCFALREVDGQKRFYRLDHLRADDGIHEIINTLEGLPKRTDVEVSAHEALWR